MKKILLLSIVVISLASQAQNYKDSVQYRDSPITLTLLQTHAFYIGQYCSNILTAENRGLIDQVKPFFGSGNDLDSTFQVTVPAHFITGSIELLLGTNLGATITDYKLIMDDSPDVANYTGLPTQIVAKANEAGPQQNTARYIRDWYLNRVAEMGAVINSYRTRMLNW